MKIILQYMPINWNEYINLERTDYRIVNNIKQREKKIVAMNCIGKKYNDEYPIEIIFKVHFKNKRMDLDNTRLKGIIDGLVTCGVIKNDNLNCIQKITIESVFDNKEIIEIEIKKL